MVDGRVSSNGHLNQFLADHPVPDITAFTL